MEPVGVLHHCHCSSFGASSSGKATWWEVLEKFEFAHSSGSGSKAQGLDHACPLGPGARSARLLFSVLGLKHFGLSHSLNLIETLCTDASFSQGKQVSVPILLGMRGRLSPERACWGMLSAHSEVSKLWEATKTGLGGVGRVYLGGPGLSAGSERVHRQVLAWRKGRGIQSFLPARSRIGAKFLLFTSRSRMARQFLRGLCPLMRRIDLHAQVV